MAERALDALRCCPLQRLAGKALTFDVELLRLVKAGGMEKATFGAGCFW